MTEYDYVKTHGEVKLEPELFLDSLIVPLGDIRRPISASSGRSRISSRINKIRSQTSDMYYNRLNFNRFGGVIESSLGLDNRLYTLDTNITLKRFIQQKSTRTKEIGSVWDIYSFMSHLKQIRNWKHNYETRRAAINKSEFDMKSVLEFTDTDLVAAIHGNYHGFYWQQSYNNPKTIMGYDAKDYYETLTWLPSLEQVDKKLHEDIFNKINTEYFLQKLERIKTTIRVYKKSYPEYDYLIVSHDKRDNIGWNSISGYTKIGNTSGLGQRRMNAISLNLKTFTDRIEVLEEHDFDAKVKLQELKVYNNSIMQKTITALQRARPIQDPEDDYYRGHKDVSGKKHDSVLKAKIADLEIMIGRFVYFENHIQKYAIKLWGDSFDEPVVKSEAFWVRAERINHLLRSTRKEKEETQKMIFGDNLQHYKYLNKAVSGYIEHCRAYVSGSRVDDEFDEKEIEEGLKLLGMTDEQINTNPAVSLDYTSSYNSEHLYSEYRNLIDAKCKEYAKIDIIYASPSTTVSFIAAGVYKDAKNMVDDFNTKADTLVATKAEHQAFLKHMKCVVIKRQANLMDLKPVGLRSISAQDPALEMMNDWRWYE